MPPLTLDIHTFDPGISAPDPGAFADLMAQRVESSWDSGADLVLLPEFSWLGLEPFTTGTSAPSSLHAVSDLFWSQILPVLSGRLSRPGKAVVLGTCPCFDPRTGTLHNRAPIFADGKTLHQNKLHLTPWENAFTPGDTLHVWEFGGLRIAVIICLDIEIPELSARLRDLEVDLILCPSATENILGVERVDRCASARAVELGCYVAVSHLTGRASSDLIDVNIGRTALYTPSQSAFRKAPRWTEGEVIASGVQTLRVILDQRLLVRMRRMRAETNPSLLGKELAGMAREIRIQCTPSPTP